MISAYEFLKKFSDEWSACLHIEDRWRHGKLICPHYGESHSIQTRKGVSSLRAPKEIGVTQKTACFMFQRSGEACGSFLSGIVEADETCIGGLDYIDALIHKTNGVRLTCAILTETFA